MSIASFSVLRIVKQETVAAYSSPPSDSIRRLKAFTKASENAVSLIVSFHPNLKLPRADGFPH
jgi:hypothetical protein